MNTNHDEHLPEDLKALNAALDRLGASEQLAASFELEARVSERALSARMGATMEQLAEAERLSAPPRLETDVFETSVRELRPARMAIMTRRMSWALRAAAAIAIAGAGLTAYLSMRAAPTEAPNDYVKNLNTQKDLDSVLAMMASIDSATMHEQVESLAEEIDGLNPESLRERPRLLDAATEGAM